MCGGLGVGGGGWLKCLVSNIQSADFWLEAANSGMIAAQGRVWYKCILLWLRFSVGRVGCRVVELWCGCGVVWTGARGN